MRANPRLMEKIHESMAAVPPITAVVPALSVTIAPLEPGTLVLFLFGAVMLICGMGFFTLGVDMSMIPMGDGVGGTISHTRSMAVSLAVCQAHGLRSEAEAVICSLGVDRFVRL